MTFLFPRLSVDHCLKIASSWEHAAPRSILRHDQQTYAPIGGSRVTDSTLEDLCRRVRALTLQANPSGERSSTDAPLGQVLREEMRITCHEAAQPEVWQFVACALLPDVLMWRFGDDERKVNERRWQGDLRRNAFGRLWWRAEILGGSDLGTTDVMVLAQLREDEIVQIMERPSLSGNRVLARCIAEEFLSAIEKPSEAVARVRDFANGRQLIMREVTKRLLRVGFVRPFETLDETQLRSLVSEQLEATCELIANYAAPPMTRKAA